ncbi:MAG TPA: hypothetical protein PLT94_04080, partial [Rhodocyclaceae bacterium]|nr:hypothetical protein [Rhodocyclaceae bacterium]
MFHKNRRIRTVVALSALASALLALNVGAQTTVNGLKLRGDGTIDDTQPRSANTVGGVKLRGNGTVDDTQPGGTTVGGVKRRGDGSIDD